jgi:hypothetical protein
LIGGRASGVAVARVRPSIVMSFAWRTQRPQLGSVPNMLGSG